MRIGVIFPQKEIGADPVAVRDYAQAAEDLGYDHLLVYDHVLGADASKHEGWKGLSHTDMFHEPFVHVRIPWQPSPRASNWRPAS